MIAQPLWGIRQLAQPALQLQPADELGLVPLQAQVEGHLVPSSLPISTLVTLAIPCNIFCTVIMPSMPDNPSTTSVWLEATPEMRAP